MISQDGSERMKWLFIREFSKEKKSVIWPVILTCISLAVMLIAFVLGKSSITDFTDFINTILADISGFLKMQFPVVTDVVWSVLLVVMFFGGIFIVWDNLLRTERIFHRDEQNRQVYIMCNQMYGRRQLIIAKFLTSVIMMMIQYFLWTAVFAIIDFAAFKIQVIKSMNISQICEFGIVWCSISVLLSTLYFFYVILSNKHCFVNKLGFFVVIICINLWQMKYGISLMQAMGSIIVSIFVMLLNVKLYDLRDI